MMADNGRLTDRLRELELALAVVEQQCMRYQTLYYDTKKALDTLRAVRTQRAQDVAQAVDAAVRAENEACAEIAAGWRVGDIAGAIRARREGRGMSEKTYLGDSVYAEHAGGIVKLTTDNGMGPSNTIYLEVDVLDALCAFATSLGWEPKG
jgi:hypothetical protein